MWDEPEPELSHGTVIRYNIGYKQVDDDGDNSGGGVLFWSKKSNYFERLSDIFESVSVVVSLIPPFPVWIKEPAPVLRPRSLPVA